MLVGDLIMNVRSLGPDPPQALLPPLFISATPTTVGGGSLFATTFYLVLTGTNLWGETIASQERSVTLAPGQNAIIVGYNIAPGTKNVRAYIGTSSGVETGWLPIAGTGFNPTLDTISSLVNTVSGAPPARASAWLPDTDGGFVAVTTMYRWLNDTMRTIARAAGGIQDACGIASISGNRRLVAPGQWIRFDQCFYDGWELDLGNKAETFRNRNLTANIAISLMVDAQSDTTRIELYWTPSRTSGTATLTGPITTDTTIIPITGISSWLLADGYASITDSFGNGEIITYSSQNFSNLSGCIRGWSGTQPFAFQAGATVQELNVELNGYRMPYVYSVGQSAVTLGVPPGWEPFLKDYLLGTFRKAEQETQEGEALQKSATQGIMEWVKSNKSVAGPRQMRMYGDYGLRGTVPGGLTGPIIIP